MRSEERYCKRYFHGFMDQRELYDEIFDVNSHLSDDIDNFKYNPDMPEDVEVFCWAFCDRISRIWQNADEYFHKDPLLMDLFDAYSNLVFQLHMVEFYSEAIKDAIGERNYKEIDFDGIIATIKKEYSTILLFKERLNRPEDKIILEMTEKFDKLSKSIYDFGVRAGMPF